LPIRSSSALPFSTWISVCIHVIAIGQIPRKDEVWYAPSEAICKSAWTRSLFWFCLPTYSAVSSSCSSWTEWTP
jgi:hypothetical protein